MSKYRVIGGLFFVMIAAFIAWRVSSFACDAEYTTSHGIEVYADGGIVPARDDMEAEIKATIDAWLSVPGFDEERISDRLRGTRVFIKPWPFEFEGELKNGVAKPLSKRIAIGIDERGVGPSALGHELGHLIGQVNEKQLAELSRLYGVPY